MKDGKKIEFKKEETETKQTEVTGEARAESKDSIERTQAKGAKELTRCTRTENSVCVFDRKKDCFLFYLILHEFKSLGCPHQGD